MQYYQLKVLTLARHRRVDLDRDEQLLCGCDNEQYEVTGVFTRVC